MSKELQDIIDVLNIKKKIKPDTKLDSLREWDSMGSLSIIGLADSKYKKIINGDDLSRCITVSDIILLLK